MNPGHSDPQSGTYPELSEVSERLRWAIATAGVSNRALADALAVSPSRVSEWTRESGAVTPRPSTLARIAEFLRIDPTWLMHGRYTPELVPDTGNATTDGLLGNFFIEYVAELRRARAYQDLAATSAALLLNMADRLPAEERTAVQPQYAALREAMAAIPGLPSHSATRALEQELEAEARRHEQRPAADAPAKRDPERRAQG